MNIEVLEKIKVIEHDHTLKILVINHNADILVSDLIQLKNLGEITIATSTPLMVSQLLGKLSGLKYNIVLTTRIPIKNYDMIISNEFTDLIKSLRDILYKDSSDIDLTLYYPINAESRSLLIL